MNRLSPAVQRWLATHHGVTTTRQLRLLGTSPRARAHLVADGVLLRPTRGVLVLAGTPATLHQRCAVLCATYPGGFVTGPTAGMLAGLRRMPRSSGLHFSVRHGINPEPEPGVRFRQTTALRANDRLVRPDGIVVASPARLAFDLAADLGRVDHLSVVNQLLDREDVALEQLTAIGRRLCHPARRGSRRFALTMMSVDGREPQDSHDEVELLDALRTRGIPVEPQVPLRASPRPIHVDLGVAAVRWAIELDIHPEHRTLEGQRQDAERRSAANELDWQIETVTELQMDELATTVERLVASYERRCLRRSA